MENVELTLDEMKNNIEEAGGLFYQYRPCRVDVSTIYDIENIRHGVVYAQTPLNMNDPFDSMIGYSPNDIYKECISIILKSIGVEGNSRVVVELLLINKALGNFAEFLVILNKLKKYIQRKKVRMHQMQLADKIFVSQYRKELYSNCPKEIKKFFTIDEFLVFAAIVVEMKEVDITEQALLQIVNLDKLLDEIYEAAFNFKDREYLPFIEDLLSKITVTCFSSSGWDNQLMWSHYANSYAGICIEYDLSKISDFKGFIYPVKYLKERPTLSLRNLGFDWTMVDGKLEAKQNEVDMKAIFDYMLSKNECWEYEKEWRIINIGEEYTPKFIDLPYIKSITFGLRMDPLCRKLLLDLCNEKGVECYQLRIDTEDFSLKRELWGNIDETYDEDEEVKYVSLLIDQIVVLSERIQHYEESIENAKSFDLQLSKQLLAYEIDVITNAFFLKHSLNRIVENSKDDLVKDDETMNAINEFVKMLNNTTIQVEESLNDIENVLPKLRMMGLFNSNDGCEVLKQLNVLRELVEKIKLIELKYICLE